LNQRKYDLEQYKKFDSQKGANSNEKNNSLGYNGNFCCYVLFYPRKCWFLDFMCDFHGVSQFQYILKRRFPMCSCWSKMFFPRAGLACVCFSYACVKRVWTILWLCIIYLYCIPIWLSFVTG